MQPVQELWKMLKLHTPLNDRNRMIGIVINRKQEYNISVKQYLSESNNLKNFVVVHNLVLFLGCLDC